MSKLAFEIAKDHLEKANPSLWDGQGKRPDDFDIRIGTYPLDENTEVDVSFEYDESGNELGWMHLCELRDRGDGGLLNIVSDTGINSIQSIAASIDAVYCGNLDDTIPA